MADRSNSQEWISDPFQHGSARWADAAHLVSRGYGPGGFHLLGYHPSEYIETGAMPVTYGGARHELIAAPTRGGKGVSGAIPRLLDHPGGAVVLDVKDGELALITARYRRDVLGQNVFLIDPFDCVASELGMDAAKLDPMQIIDLEGDEPFDDALLLADACVIPEGSGESHWSGEAAALIAGLMLEQAQFGGTLAGVRQNLNRNADQFAELIEDMAESPYDLVRDAAGRITSKSDRELSGVISTAQRNTHFLEGKSLASSLSVSDFDLKSIGENTTIYIVLPGRRIRTAKRWLRVLLSTLINAVTALDQKPALPVLFLIEEMAALERLQIIESSYGLMAGYGILIVGVVQDFTQLRDLYKDRWQTFIANSASVQCFGTNDYFTAHYLSQLCGTGTVERASYNSASERTKLFGVDAYRSMNDGLTGRQLITPDELMSLHPSIQFIKFAASRPFIGYRPVYYLDRRYRDAYDRPLYDIHPHHADRPILPSVDFTAPGLDLGSLLADHLEVG
ncbi:MAG: type IV secretory system conjugative DNA transfer family protein [Litorimonas sp.]